ncbi:MAG TPA: HpcH/HpaI aldolase/citrate lyase family protein [Candidatus Saccharimonadales bacterium]|nr:HpcH/HpaI aldolase/citrate lyase family protein [Candidatus Saccharimonadales bacterium]
MKRNAVMHPTLYTPATTSASKLVNLTNGRVAGVWRVVLCTEDSIRPDDVPVALATLRTVLKGMDSTSGVETFVRVRNPEVMARVLDLPDVDKLHGFVLPKADPTSFPEYADQVAKTDRFRLMPILESPLMTDNNFRATLRMVLSDKRYHSLIDCVRIGANDLMGHLGIRRDDTSLTVYDTPVGVTIFEIINEFRGLAGFTVTAPVFECYAPEYDELLRREVRRNIMNGLFGQTVIHPRHIRIIRDMYKVSKKDLKSARGIMKDSTAVRGVEGKMDERATHLKWAQTVLDRHSLFGDSAVSHAMDEILD